MWSERPLVGHEDAVRALASADDRGRFPSAWLFAGEDGIGKRRLAQWVVQRRACRSADRPCGACGPCRKVVSGNHPDVEFVERDPPPERDPEGLGSRFEITVAQIRRIVAVIGLRPVESGGRTVVIDDADTMNVEAQNALLKTLEEPPAGCLVVLVTSAEEALLETVRSRCQMLRLQPLSDEQVRAVVPRATPSALRLARGRPGRVADLERLDADELDAALEAVLAGRIAGSAFARRLAAVVDGAGEGEGAPDPQRARRLALDVLHEALVGRARALVGAEDGGPPPARDQDELLRRAEAAILQAGRDLGRHLTPAVTWAALGDALASLAVP